MRILFSQGSFCGSRETPVPGEWRPSRRGAGVLYGYGLVQKKGQDVARSRTVVNCLSASSCVQFLGRFDQLVDTAVELRQLPITQGGHQLLFIMQSLRNDFIEQDFAFFGCQL